LRLRELMPHSVFLLPGIGAQGGEVQAVNTLRCGNEASVLVPISRGIAKVETVSMPLDKYRATVTERIKSFKNTLAMNA
jgi:orotidine-5'-phosphate decarboxylase